MSRFASVALVSALLSPMACEPPRTAPPPILPAEDGRRVAPPPIDADDVPVGASGNGDANASSTRPPLPPPTGDRELDALRVGFYGCRVMGLRIMPAMDGTALLNARLGAGGEVLDVTPVTVVGIPHTVVTCLVERVWNAHFDPRGGYGSVLVIPVDFRRDPKQEPAPAKATGGAPAREI